MVKLAIQHHAQFSINEFELQQKNTSYTVNTLTHLRAQHPAQSLCLIVGSDAFSHFHKWHQFEKIMTLANLIVVTRNTKNNTYSPLLEKYITTERQRLKDNLAGFIYFEKINPISISATQIRNDITSGKKRIEGLNPSVEAYIKKNKVY